MSRSGLVTRVYNSPQKSSRNGVTVDSLIWHWQAGSVAAYKAATGWSGYASQIQAI